jgi:glyoxylase-like metal-dependent hydrolase (beta-lactamase superfamily II)
MAHPAPTQIADGVHRLGTRLVNWYVVEDGGRVTIVDCGLPGYFDQVEPGLRAIGRSLDDVEAIVLTHGDGDHVGFSEKLRSSAGVPVLIHREDERIATTDAHKKTEKGIAPYLVRPAAWGLMAEFGRNGGLKPPAVGAVTTFEDGQALDVPGALRVVHTPGHTDGHCVIHFERAGVVFAGDAMCTRNPFTGRIGAQVLPAGLNVSSEHAMASLDRLAATGAAVVAPGHGDPYTGGAAKAVEDARAAGFS